MNDLWLIVMLLIVVAFTVLFFLSQRSFEKTILLMVRDFEVERQKLLDRIQARDLPEFKAMTRTHPPLVQKPHNTDVHQV